MCKKKRIWASNNHVFSQILSPCMFHVYICTDKYIHTVNIYVYIVWSHAYPRMLQTYNTCTDECITAIYAARTRVFFNNNRIWCMRWRVFLHHGLRPRSYVPMKLHILYMLTNRDGAIDFFFKNYSCTREKNARDWILIASQQLRLSATVRTCVYTMYVAMKK